MEQRTLEIMRKKLEVAGQVDFSTEIEAIYENVKAKAVKNRDKHFTIQHRILYISGGVSIANVFVTLCNSYSKIAVLAPIITGIASALSITVTLLIAQKSSSKYSETWLRHQMHQADMEFEIMEYVYDNGIYQSGSPIENAEKLKDNMFRIWKKNQEKFNSNMVDFDKD